VSSRKRQWLTSAARCDLRHDAPQHGPDSRYIRESLRGKSYGRCKTEGSAG
jgi:hypothetical protein